MKGTIVALSLLMSFASFAATTSIGVVDLEAPQTSTEPYLAFATDGEIYEIDQNDENLVELAKQAHIERKMIKVKLDNFSDAADVIGIRSKIQKITISSKAAPVVAQSEELLNKSIDYNPSDLMNDYISDVGSRQNVTNIFYTMRQDTKSKSQCYNRAHVWSWEIYNQHSYGNRRVQTGKIWIFFTRKYIKEYKYKWWFHIAPFLRSNGEDLIIDRKFSRAPLEERDWTNTFIQSRSYCPQVSRYTDYSENQWSSHCYVMKTSVHYWQPFNIEKLETQGLDKKGWKSGEIQGAYNDAVKGYGGWFSSKTAPYL